MQVTRIEQVIQVARIDQVMQVVGLETLNIAGHAGRSNRGRWSSVTSNRVGHADR